MSMIYYYEKNNSLDLRFVVTVGIFGVLALGYHFTGAPKVLSDYNYVFHDYRMIVYYFYVFLF